MTKKLSMENLYRDRIIGAQEKCGPVTEKKQRGSVHKSNRNPKIPVGYVLCAESIYLLKSLAKSQNFDQKC